MLSLLQHTAFGPNSVSCEACWIFAAPCTTCTTLRHHHPLILFGSTRSLKKGLFPVLPVDPCLWLFLGPLMALVPPGFPSLCSDHLTTGTAVPARSRESPGWTLLHVLSDSKLVSWIWPRPYITWTLSPFQHCQRSCALQALFLIWFQAIPQICSSLWIVGWRCLGRCCAFLHCCSHWHWFLIHFKSC